MGLFYCKKNLVSVSSSQVVDKLIAINYQNIRIVISNLRFFMVEFSKLIKVERRKTSRVTGPGLLCVSFSVLIAEYTGC